MFDLPNSRICYPKIPDTGPGLQGCRARSLATIEAQGTMRIDAGQLVAGMSEPVPICET